MEPTIKIALVGAGMFGGDVHLRAYADLQRFGIAGKLARVALDKFNRELAPVKFDLVAVATRSQKSAAKSAAAFKEWTSEGRATRVALLSSEESGTRVARPSESDGASPKAYWGDEPW